MDCCSTSISLPPKAWKQKAAQLKMATVMAVGLAKQLESLPVPHSTIASHHKERAQTLALAFLGRTHNLGFRPSAFGSMSHPLPLASGKNNTTVSHRSLSKTGPDVTSVTARQRANSLRKYLEIIVS